MTTRLYDGTNTTITHTTGDYIFDNTNTTGSSIFRLGTDTSATDFQVQNNSASAVLTVDATGLTTLVSHLVLGDSDEIRLGASTDFTITHNGTTDTIFDNTHVTGATIFRLGTDDANTNFQIQNNSASAVFTVGASGIVTLTNNLVLADSDEIRVGTGTDFTIVHGGTNTNITSTTGDLIIDNTNTTGSTIFIMGTDTSATDFQVQNNSTTAQFTVLGSGATTIASTSLSIGGVSYTWPGSDGSNGNVLQTNGSGTLTWGGVSASFASGSQRSFILNQSEADNTTSGDVFGLYFKRNELDVIGDTAFASGTADSGTTTTLTATALNYGSSSTLIGALIKITGGTASGDVRKITAFNTVTDTITANSAFSATIDNTSQYEIYNQIYPAIVYDHNANALVAKVYKNENSGASLTGNFAFECGTLKTNGILSARGDLSVYGLATLFGGGNMPASQTMAFGNSDTDKGTISYISSTFTLTSTDNTTMSIGDNYSGAENKFNLLLGSTTGNTRFEVSDGNYTSKFSVNDNGNISIVDSFYRQATLLTTNTTASQKIFTYNCRHFNSIVVESDIIGTSVINSAGYSTLDCQSFKLIATFMRNAAWDFTQVGSTDKLSIGGESYDSAILTSGNFLTVEVSPTGASGDVNWKSFNKVIFVSDDKFNAGA